MRQPREASVASVRAAAETYAGEDTQLWVGVDPSIAIGKALRLGEGGGYKRMIDSHNKALK